jgi:hypothetical protein
MEPALDSSATTIDELPETSPPASWRSRLLALLDVSLDAVRVVTAVLAAYQVARMAGVPGVERVTLLEALSLWQLIGIYLLSVALTLAVGRVRPVRRPRARPPTPHQHGAPTRVADEDRPATH